MDLLRRIVQGVANLPRHQRSTIDDVPQTLVSEGLHLQMHFISFLLFSLFLLDTTHIKDFKVPVCLLVFVMG